MNFPLFKSFRVSRLLTSFLNRKFDENKKQVGVWDNENSFDAELGYQSKNLLRWKDKEFKNFVDGKLKRFKFPFPLTFIFA